MDKTKTLKKRRAPKVKIPFPYDISEVGLPFSPSTAFSKTIPYKFYPQKYLY